MCVCVYVFICMYMYMYMCVGVWMYIHMCVYIYIYDNPIPRRYALMGVGLNVEALKVAVQQIHNGYTISQYIYIYISRVKG